MQSKPVLRVSVYVGCPSYSAPATGICINRVQEMCIDRRATCLAPPQLRRVPIFIVSKRTVPTIVLDLALISATAIYALRVGPAESYFCREETLGTVRGSILTWCI